MTDRQNTYRPVTEISSDVYDLTLTRDPARYRAYLFDWDVPTLVDCGPAEASSTLLDRIDTCGVIPERLILTHADHDHVGGFDAIIDRYNPTTWVPEQSCLDTKNDPNRRYVHEDQIGPFTAVHVPGHTEDNYALVTPKHSLAIMGDALIGADWRGLPAGYFILVEGIYSDDLRAAERNVERLQDYAFDVGLVFHGSSVLEDAREKLDAYLDFPNKGDWSD